MKFNLLPECLLPYTHPIIYPECIGCGVQNTGKPNKLYGIHVTIWLKCYRQNFCGVGSVSESNIFMLKSET